MRIHLFFLATMITMAAVLPLSVLQAQNGSPYWSQEGNNNASYYYAKLGTTNAVPLRLYTNNYERLHVDIYGNVGIGTTSPSRHLHVTGGGIFGGQLTVQSGGFSAVNSSGTAVYGGSSNSYGVYGSGTYGVYGAGSSYGVYGYSGSYYGVYGNGATGVYGTGTSNGLYGYSGSGFGAYGYSTNNAGVYGYSTNYRGGYFYSAYNYGLWAKTGRTDKSWAGVFEGNLYAYGAYQTSDKSLKQNIEDFGEALTLISKLKPRSYEFRKDGKLAALNLPKGKHYGLLAQELEEVLPDLVMEVENEVSLPGEIAPILPSSATPDGTPPALTAPPAQPGERITIKAINYTELIPLLIKAIQEQQEQIQQLKEEVSHLKKGRPTVLLNGTGLGEVSPNPARGAAVIPYAVPEGTARAQLLITDAAGRAVRQITLRGSGVANVDVSTLADGVYNYSLVVDNNTVATKKMTVVR